MKENERMPRRMFLRTVALGSVATAATLASMSPRKVFSQTKEEWRVIDNWGEEPDEHKKLFAKMVSEGTEGLISIKFYGPGKIVPFPTEAKQKICLGSQNSWKKSRL